LHPYIQSLQAEIALGTIDRVPIARVELLPATNKGYTSEAENCQKKRLELLHDDLLFIELDYLHETPPTFIPLPDYRPRSTPRHDTTAHAYRIVVLDPRPSPAQGFAYLYAFDVDQPIPHLVISLRQDMSLTFDFGEPYYETIAKAAYGYTPALN
jgi:hypothetical protein